MGSEKKTAAFHDAVWSACDRLGQRNVRAIANDLLNNLCKPVYDAAKEIGIETYLRDGICRGVAEVLKAKGDSAAHQIDFAEIERTFGLDKVDMVRRLAAEAHYVPSLGILIPIRELMDSKKLFNEARTFKWQKSDEVREQAEAMDELYKALWPPQASDPKARHPREGEEHAIH